MKTSTQLTHRHKQRSPSPALPAWLLQWSLLVSFCLLGAARPLQANLALREGVGYQIFSQWNDQCVSSEPAPSKGPQQTKETVVVAASMSAERPKSSPAGHQAKNQHQPQEGTKSVLRLRPCDRHSQAQAIKLKKSAQSHLWNLTFGDSQQCLTTEKDHFILADCSPEQGFEFRPTASAVSWRWVTPQGKCLAVANDQSRSPGGLLCQEPCQAEQATTVNDATSPSPVMRAMILQKFQFAPLLEAATSSPSPAALPPLLLTYQNKKKDRHTRHFKRSLKKWGWSFEVLGEGQPWVHFGTKITGYLQRLEQLVLEHPDQVVLLSDSTDVLANNSPARFLENYLRIADKSVADSSSADLPFPAAAVATGAGMTTHTTPPYPHPQIVVSAEKGCCVNPMKYFSPGDFLDAQGQRKASAITDLAKLQSLSEGTLTSRESEWQERMLTQKQALDQGDNGLDFHYLNSGMIAGRADDLLELLRFLKTEEAEHDQALITEYWLHFPEKLKVDYQNTLFSNAHGWEDWDALTGCFFTWDAHLKHFHHQESFTQPTLIQTPGKYWTCYGWLNSFIRRR